MSKHILNCETRCRGSSYHSGASSIKALTKHESSSKKPDTCIFTTAKNILPNILITTLLLIFTLT
jgi:hypothetical protein